MIWLTSRLKVNPSEERTVIVESFSSSLCASDGGKAAIQVNAPGHPLTLAFRPDGSLDAGSGPYQVHGRIVTGQNDDGGFGGESGSGGRCRSVDSAGAARQCDVVDRVGTSGAGGSCESAGRAAVYFAARQLWRRDGEGRSERPGWCVAVQVCGNEVRAKDAGLSEGFCRDQRACGFCDPGRREWQRYVPGRARRNLSPDDFGCVYK